MLEHEISNQLGKKAQLRAASDRLDRLDNKDE